jgi:hypothetical protein
MAPASVVKQAALRDSQPAAVPAGKAVLPVGTPPSAMQAAVTAMDSVNNSLSESSCLVARDYIFNTMQQKAGSAASLPGMFPASSENIGSCTANIAILSVAQPQDITPDMITTVFNCLNSNSGCVRDKAQQVLGDVLQQQNLSRACADTAAAGMRSIVSYFAKNSPAAISNTNGATPLASTPAAHGFEQTSRPANAPTNSQQAVLQASNNNSKDGSPQLPPLATWALDMLLNVAHVDEDSFLGCMMGSAVGDMLGLPIEGNSRKLCQQYVQDVVLPVKTTTYHR